MSLTFEDILHSYLRELGERRMAVVLATFVIAIITLTLAVTWPKSYTSSATIFPDNSNILRPLMEGNAVTTGIVDQARLAQDILFHRDFEVPILEAAGYDPGQFTPAQQEQMVLNIQNATRIENIARNPASLIRISHTDVNPIKAFTITQKYSSLFLEQSVIAKQMESRSAFEFIENQVKSYQAKLQASEDRLSKFKSQNNFGTLGSSNNRINAYRAEMERLALDDVQLDTQIASVEAQLAGETEVSRDLSAMNAVRARINSLQITLDSLRSRYHDGYPDVVAVVNQIADLQDMMASGVISVQVIEPNDNTEGSMTPLRQQLRSSLAALRTEKESNLSQLESLQSLLEAEEERAILINSNEAELAELTRDYNVTQDFYNEMLRRLESARVSMHLDEEQQGVTFKIQESAAIPTRPDGFSLWQLTLGSFVLSLILPIAILVTYMELDNRINSEARWSPDWPPLVAIVPPMSAKGKSAISTFAFFAVSFVLLVGLYGGFGTLHLMGYF